MVNLLALLLSLSLPTGSIKKVKIKNVKVVKYKGVTPPSPRLPKILPKPGKACLLVWPGFQFYKKSKTSRFFFMFTSSINLKIAKITVKKVNYLRLIIPNCSAWQKNAWRDLITHYFKTPVEKVSFYRHRTEKNMVIDIEYKKHIVMPKISRTTFMGYYLLLLEYPKLKK